MAEPNLEALLQRVNKYINIDDERANYNVKYTTLRDHIMKQLLMDPNFKNISKGHRLEGSYRDNVKISKPNEYDLVILLQLNKFFRVISTEQNGRPSYVKIICNPVSERSQHIDVNMYNHFTQMTDSRDHCLLKDKLLSWLQSLFAKAIFRMGHKITVDGVVFRLTYQNLGPAHTIKMFDDYGEILSVDFVPGIKLSCHPDNCTALRQCGGRMYTELTGIPKPLPSSLDHINNKLYRKSHFEDELQLMKNRDGLKNAMRFLKKYRDCHQNMSNMKSYYIKTLFLWKSHGCTDKYWNTPLTDIVIDMFTAMEDSLSRRSLLFFWDTGVNLYQDLSEHQLRDMLNCVSSDRGLLQQARFKMPQQFGDKSRFLSIFLTSREIPLLPTQAEAIAHPLITPTTSMEESEESRESISSLIFKFLEWAVK